MRFVKEMICVNGAYVLLFLLINVTVTSRKNTWFDRMLSTYVNEKSSWSSDMLNACDCANQIMNKYLKNQSFGFACKSRGFERPQNIRMQDFFFFVALTRMMLTFYNVANIPFFVHSILRKCHSLRLNHVHFGNGFSKCKRIQFPTHNSEE